MHAQARTQPKEQIQQKRQKNCINMARNCVKTCFERVDNSRGRRKTFSSGSFHNMLILPYRVICLLAFPPCHRYNLNMQENRSYLPNSDRVGILIASVLLTYALTRIVQTPSLPLSIVMPGFYFAYPLTLNTGMSILAGALAFTGMDWLTRGHPSLGAKTNIEHLLLPTLTTLVLGGPLALLPDGLIWWGGFVFGAFLLVGVYLAEYITIEPSAPMYAFARAGLTALASALFLIMPLAIRFSVVRVVLLF